MTNNAARTSTHIETHGHHSPVAGRDVIIGNHTYIDANPLPTGGPLKIFSVAGVILSLIGFASFGYVVLSIILVILSALATPTPGRPPDMGSVPFVPFLPLGAALFLLGMALLVIASVASSGRRRHCHRR
jgi:hypothetical protein